MTPDGVIQSEEGLKQYLARVENDQPMGHLESIPLVRDTLDIRLYKRLNHENFGSHTVRATRRPINIKQYYQNISL